MRRLLFLLIFGALAGCGPRTIKSVLFPVIYNVRVETTIHDGKGASVITTYANCNVFDGMDSIAANIHTTQTGGKIWHRLPNGAALVVQGVGVCPWKKSVPATGTVFTEQASDYKDASNVSYIFSSRTAYAVDAIQDKVLFNQISDPAIEGLKITAVSRIAPHNDQESAFPELQRIAEYQEDLARRHIMLEGGVNSRLQNGLYVGVVGEAWRFHGISGCHSPDEKPVILSQRDQCQYMNYPCDNGQRILKDNCEEYVGRILPTPSYNFAEFDASLDDFQKTVDKRLYSADALIRAGLGVSGQDFRPRICVNGLCATPTRTSNFILMYFPNENTLVRVWAVGDNIFPSEIGAQRW